MKVAGKLRCLGCLKVNFMKYLWMPLHQHYDCGLGATAQYFSDAAKALNDCESHLMNSDLPLFYLRRHSIELFLKSLIYILHKKYNISFGEGFTLEKPGVLLGEKWKGMFSTHDLIGLYVYFSRRFGEVKSELPDEVNWELPKRIEEQIKLIGGVDPKSDYFRYPQSTNYQQDFKKSSDQEIDMNQLLAKMSKGPTMTTLLVNSTDEVQNVYIHDAILPEFGVALREVCEFFSGVHAAFRWQLTKGR